MVSQPSYFYEGTNILLVVKAPVVFTSLPVDANSILYCLLSTAWWPGICASLADDLWDILDCLQQSSNLQETADILAFFR